MTKYTDAVVYDAGQKLQLAVEIKNKRGKTLDWVIKMRRNLLAHSLLPDSPYFLLALADFFYLWKQGMPFDWLAPPDYKIEAMAALAPYLESSGLSLDEISEHSFQFLVTAWLQDLMNSDLTREAIHPGLQALFDSDLYEAIKNGSLVVEPAMA